MIEPDWLIAPQADGVGDVQPGVSAAILTDDEGGGSLPSPVEIAVVGVEGRQGSVRVVGRGGVEGAGGEPVPVQNGDGIAFTGLGMPPQKVVVLRTDLADAVAVPHDVEIGLGEGHLEQTGSEQGDRQDVSDQSYRPVPPHEGSPSPVKGSLPHPPPSRYYGTPNNPGQVDEPNARRRFAIPRRARSTCPTNPSTFPPCWSPTSTAH